MYKFISFDYMAKYLQTQREGSLRKHWVVKLCVWTSEEEHRTWSEPDTSKNVDQAIKYKRDPTIDGI